MAMYARSSGSMVIIDSPATLTAILDLGMIRKK